MRDCFLRNSLIYFKHDITTVFKSHYHSQNLINQLWQWSNAWLRWQCSLRTTLFHFPLVLFEFHVVLFLCFFLSDVVGKWWLNFEARAVSGGSLIRTSWYKCSFLGTIMGASELLLLSDCPFNSIVFAHFVLIRTFHLSRLQMSTSWSEPGTLSIME